MQTLNDLFLELICIALAVVTLDLVDLKLVNLFIRELISFVSSY